MALRPIRCSADTAAMRAQRARFVANRCWRDSCDPSSGFRLKSARRKPRPSNRTLDNCWEQPKYPINVSEFLGISGQQSDFVTVIRLTASGQSSNVDLKLVVHRSSICIVLRNRGEDGPVETSASPRVHFADELGRVLRAPPTSTHN